MAPCSASSRLLAPDAASARDAFSQLTDRFRPSVLDVLKVAHDLTHGTLAAGSPGSARIPLPADVARLILQRAEYFHSRHAERRDWVTVATWDFLRQTPATPYYETLPADDIDEDDDDNLDQVGHTGLQYIVCDSALELPLRGAGGGADATVAECAAPCTQLARVDVAVVAHDQGWSEGLGPGAWTSSWTWGTLAAIPWPLVGSGAAGQDALSPRHGPGGEVREEVVYRNARGQARWQLHEASWGPQSELVALLRRGGGRVALHLRAQFPGWCHHALCASITLTYS